MHLPPAPAESRDPGSLHIRQFEKDETIWEGKSQIFDDERVSFATHSASTGQAQWIINLGVR